MARLIDSVWVHGKRLGPIWLRLISWGVISEEEALLLASQSPRTSPGFNFFGDSGAKFCLSYALGKEVDAVREYALSKNEGATPLHGAVISFLCLAATDGGDPATRDDRLVKSLEGSPYTPDEIREAIADLKTLGVYDDVVNKALSERGPAPEARKTRRRGKSKGEK
jgi:hypothetical protein